MFGSLRQSLNASFADRFVESNDGVHFRPLGSRQAYRLSPTEAAASISEFATVMDRADRTRDRAMKAIVPAVILWAFACLFLRKNVSREMFGDVFYIATATGLMVALPVFAYGQFWLAAFRHTRGIERKLASRPSIEVPIASSYRTRNPFQFALRWTALLALGAFILIGGILPETHPQLGRDLRPWISFEFDTLLLGLGILYGLSMLWDWIAARRAAG